MKKLQLPPTTIRYCACCKDERTFKYDRRIGHSRCKECGWHYIPTLDPDGLYEKEVLAFEIIKNSKIPTEEEIKRRIQLQKLKELKSFRYKINKKE